MKVCLLFPNKTHLAHISSMKKAVDLEPHLLVFAGHLPRECNEDKGLMDLSRLKDILQEGAEST